MAVKKIRLTSRLLLGMRFMAFATESGLSAIHVAELITLANAAVEVATGDTDDDVTLFQNDFDDYAKPLGFDVEWNSAIPTLVKDGKSYYLPLD